jgi:hypothetical protein
MPSTVTIFYSYSQLCSYIISNDNIIWRMRIACWIPKAKNTHSEYVTINNFLLQPWLQRTCLIFTLRWVHTCHVTTYRNAVTLQVTDTIHSYDLNFHPVPHAVTVSYERYTVGFRVCYGSQKVRGADGGDVSRCTFRPAQAVTVSSLWCDGQIPTAHRTLP